MGVFLQAATQFALPLLTRSGTWAANQLRRVGPAPLPAVDTDMDGVAMGLDRVHVERKGGDLPGESVRQAMARDLSQWWSKEMESRSKTNPVVGAVFSLLMADVPEKGWWGMSVGSFTSRQQWKRAVKQYPESAQQIRRLHKTLLTAAKRKKHLSSSDLAEVRRDLFTNVKSNAGRRLLFDVALAQVSPEEMTADVGKALIKQGHALMQDFSLSDGVRINSDQIAGWLLAGGLAVDQSNKLAA